ncbi:hypothetical protein SAMN00777080_3743 [Aquiflexum balticum DSM 16537]|uniref:Uncharacterized protein n=1 Tax=Aquiflexum balticum DSM 16537 TaxID=758820 RepID=A0A1W2H875_9BACT|nr:hypothetical protein [Aquiflexum balticum]SMD45101.1 hypothetical protein SAMN00777080_3743 [Aquiflexum balticum DSM 16537]
MHQIKVQHLITILRLSDLPVEADFNLEVNPSYLNGKGETLLKAVFEDLKGKGRMPILERLKIDFKINRFLFVYDDAVHFNRYRLSTLKSELYSTFSYPWVDSYKRLCRNFERECLKAGLQDRIWNGPPIASKVFGKSEEYGDLSGNGSAGWKLNAYNDVQYDLITRLHGFKLVRIPVYENLMTGGSLKKIDDLLLNPKEENQQMLLNWISRKLI